MLKNLYENLRFRYAVWQHQRTKRNERTTTIDADGIHTTTHLDEDERAAVHAMHTLKSLHPGVDVQAWFRKAIHTEAFTTPEPLLQVIHRVHAQGQLTASDINHIAQHGIAIKMGDHYDKINNAGRLHRLQTAVRRLAFIAGPGFTTDHLIDEGIIKQGDL